MAIYDDEWDEEQELLRIRLRWEKKCGCEWFPNDDGSEEVQRTVIVYESLNKWLLESKYRKVKDGFQAQLDQSDAYMDINEFNGLLDEWRVVSVKREKCAEYHHPSCTYDVYVLEEIADSKELNKNSVHFRKGGLGDWRNTTQ